MCPFPNQDPSAPVQLVRTSKGQILYSRPNVPIRFQQVAPGSVADYSCNPTNNIMLGDRIRTCFFNGTWSGRTPRCGKIPNTFYNDRNIKRFFSILQ